MQNAQKNIYVGFCWFNKVAGGRTAIILKQESDTGVFVNFTIFFRSLFLEKHLCEKRCSLKFHKFHRKTHVLKSRFNKDTPTQVFSCEIAGFSRAPVLKNICERLFLSFSEHLQVTVSETSKSTINCHCFISNLKWR